MKIIVGVSTGKEFELVHNDEYYADAGMVAKLINLTGVLYCNYLVATDGSLIMPKHVVYIREEDDDSSNKTTLESLVEAYEKRPPYNGFGEVNDP